MNNYILIYLIGIPISTFFLLLCTRLGEKNTDDIDASVVFASFLVSIIWPFIWALITIAFLVEYTVEGLEKRKQNK
jgi:hypothetical protein